MLEVTDNVFIFTGDTVYVVVFASRPGFQEVDELVRFDTPLACLTVTVAVCDILSVLPLPYAYTVVVLVTPEFFVTFTVIVPLLLLTVHQESFADTVYDDIFANVAVVYCVDAAGVKFNVVGLTENVDFPF